MSKTFAGLVDQYGKPLEVERPVVSRRASRLKSTYDAADDNEGTSRHWANADGLSGRASNSPEVRRKLRERARLEFDNGGNCRGAIETIAHDMIGSGPRLQLSLSDDVPPEAAKYIERAWRDWCDDPFVDYADKLRILVESELRDGEAFALIADNPAIEHDVTLSLRLIETEMVCNPDWFGVDDAFSVDGIEFDRFGNPTRYAILNEHPGDGYNWVPGDYQWHPADSVIHWFRASRASHARGVPRITPGLSLIAHIRNYTRSVLGSARLAAMLSGVLSTNLPPDTGPAILKNYDVIPMEHDALLSLPAGWSANQFKPEQPTGGYKDFRETNLTEFGRGIHAPRNIVTGDSSPYNYSSARLDHIIYRGALKVSRNRLDIRVNDRVFKAFAFELLASQTLPEEIEAVLPPISEWTWKWRYDGFPSIDPVKDSTATEIELRTGMTTYADALADKGIDWREHFQQLAAERKAAKELGIEDLLWPDQTDASQARQNTLATQQDRPQRPPSDSDDTVIDEEEAIYA